MKRVFVLLIGGLLLNSLLFAQDVLPLYDKIPNSKPSPYKEVTSNDGLRASKVSIPTLTMYTPARPNEKKAAIIICPGGGYTHLSTSREGSDVAKVISDWGVVAFVLKYRLPDDTIMIDKSIGPLQDAQRAIEMVRENAVKWNIDPTKIGIMGFSAGGHLAATASTHFDNAVIDNPKSTSLRPDFSILIYPVISFTDSLAHMGSKVSLVGKDPSPEMVKKYSDELQVAANTPPAFLVQAGDDKTVNPENSIRYYEALLKFHILAELHIYQKGGHGFGLNNKTTNDNWMERLKNWLLANSYL